MTRYDLLVRGGDVVTGAGTHRADVAVADGQIVEVVPDTVGEAARVIDATGCFVMAGAVDPHVHFNEPGRGDWEGWETGSRALVAGGVTICIEMPLNAHPPTLDRASFDAKVALASSKSRADFALWGGLTPDNLDHLEELADSGVIGFKAFMSRTGTDDFRHAGDDTLYQGMQVAASLGLPVAVHAENDAITSDLAARAQAAGRTGIRDYLASRPKVAELEAIGRAIALAESTGCTLHVVHVSTGSGVELVAEARMRGVDVSCETCPHYLAFTEDDAERIGPLAKCAPPIRSEATRELLWESLLGGDVDMLASDHSPAPPNMKQSANAFENWGGISGCQHLVAASLTMGCEREIGAEALAPLLARDAALRFQLRGKGDIAPGADADLGIWRWQDPEPLRGVRYRHPASAWDGVPMRARLVATILRGTVVYGEGAIEQATGRFLPGPCFAG
jgi:allantoinase